MRYYELILEFIAAERMEWFIEILIKDISFCLYRLYLNLGIYKKND